MIALAMSVIALPAIAQSTHPNPEFKNFNDLKWEKTNPELGDNSQEAAILHVDPTTKATQLIIRAPKNYHVGRHWHSSNETITVIHGTFVVGHDGGGERMDLTPGSFAYMPAKMIHDAWTKALLSSSRSMGRLTSTG